MAETIDLPLIGPGPVHQKQNIWLPQLFVEAVRSGQTLIEGRTFIDCHLEGPSVIAPLGGVHFEACNLGNSDGDIRNLMLLPAGGSRITGAIAFKDCTFTRCNFFAVGFTGGPEFVQQMQAGVQGPDA